MTVSVRIANRIKSKYRIWITGDNRAGKTNLAMDIAERFLRSNFRMMSNLQSPWNDNVDEFGNTKKLELDSNGQLNCMIILDEAGVYMRTKESIRLMMGAKGKLNCIFLMPSTEEPHEDLWDVFIEPHDKLNSFLRWFFGNWFVESYLKIWRMVSFDPKTGFKMDIFCQFHPKSTYYLYSTLVFGTAVDDILAQFQISLQEQNEHFGNSNMVKLQDVATKRTGIGETSSFSNQRVTTFGNENKSKISSFGLRRK